MNLNLKFFKGKYIQQICFSSNNIVICFDDQISYIQFENDFILENLEGRRIIQNVLPLNGDKGLLVLLDQIVLNAFTNESRENFILQFENNFSLTLLGNSDHESYYLKLSSNEIIIV